MAAKLPVTPEEQEAELDALFARAVELGCTDDKIIATIRAQIHDGKTTKLLQVMLWRKQVERFQAEKSAKEAKETAVAKAAGRSSTSRGLSALSNCSLRLILFALFVSVVSGIVAGLSLASLASWEYGGDASGWACSLSLFLLLPCLCGCAATILAASRNCFDSADTLCPTVWFMFILAFGIGPMVAVCYVAGPNLLQAATIANGGTAYNVSVLAPSASALRGEVSLVFAPGVIVDLAQIGVTTESVRQSGRQYTKYDCVAPLVSTLTGPMPVLYWARDNSALADDDVPSYPRHGRCFSPPEAAASSTIDIYNRPAGVHALSMGTHYYSAAWGRIDAASKLEAAKQDAMQRFSLSEGSEGALYVTAVETLRGPGSALEYFTTEAQPGIFWSLAVAPIAACGVLGFWLLGAWFKHCDSAEDKSWPESGGSVDYFACVCPGIRGEEVSWREVACCPGV